MFKQKIRQIAAFFGKARANKPLLIIFGLWVALVIFYRLFFQIRPYDTPDWFPISELYLTGFHKSGIIYLIAFWILLLVVLANLKKINEWLVILTGWALIVLGNLMQGGFVKGFLEPFYAAGNQIYSDAINVQNWVTWLAGFNANQLTFLGHTETHPPFAVLLHNIFLSPSNNQLATMAIGMSVLSMCTIPLLMVIFRLFQMDVVKRKTILLLFSVIPAVNIYSIICLDSVILTTATIFLLGMIVLLRKPEKKLLGIALMVIGFITTSMLNYGVLFLLGAGGLAGIYEIIKSKKFTIFVGLLVCVLSFVGLYLILKYGFNYDYIQSFLIASRQENIFSISFLYDIRNYGLTRFEDVSEIALFLSFPILALLTKDVLNFKKNKDFYKKDHLAVAFSGILTLLFVFLIGTYKTGETTRSCLFIYPFLFLLLLNKDQDDFLWMVILAAIQTSVMQIFFGFYW